MDLHNDPIFEMNNMNSFDDHKTSHRNFEHKIFNNDFFKQEKSNITEETLDKNRY